MESFSLVDQVIFIPLNALVKGEYIFSLGALSYNSFNNDTKLKHGDVEFTKLLTRLKIQFLRKITASI